MLRLYRISWNYGEEEHSTNDVVVFDTTLDEQEIQRQATWYAHASMECRNHAVSCKETHDGDGCHPNGYDCALPLVYDPKRYNEREFNDCEYVYDEYAYPVISFWGTDNKQYTAEMIVEKKK